MIYLENERGHRHGCTHFAFEKDADVGRGKVYWSGRAVNLSIQYTMKVVSVIPFRFLFY